MAPVVTTTSTRLNSAISRMPLRNPPGVSAPAAPKKTVHCGSVIEFSRTEAHMPSVRAWNEIRLYPSTRSATDVVFSRSRCSIGTDVSSFFVGFRMAMGAAIRAPAKRVRFSGFLLALDRLRDRPGFLPRTRANRVFVPIEKNVEIGILPLDFLDPLHDVLESDRLIVRVDSQNNPFLVLRPHGPPLSGNLQILSDSSERINTLGRRGAASYADSVGAEDRVSGARDTPCPISRATGICRHGGIENSAWTTARGAGSEIS